MAYEALDFFDVDKMLNEEEIMLRDMVRDWVDEKVIPNIEKAYNEGYFPEEWIKDLGDMGVLGMVVPEEYGCAGMSYTAYGVVCRELERGDSGLRSFVVSKVLFLCILFINLVLKNRSINICQKWQLEKLSDALD